MNMGAQCFKVDNDIVRQKLEKQIGVRICPFKTVDSTSVNNHRAHKAVFYKQQDILWKVHESLSSFEHYNYIYALEGGEQFLLKPHMNIKIDKMLYATSMDLGKYDMFTFIQYSFNWKYIQKLLLNVANGIHWLHKQNIVHRDIKLENIIIIDNTAKISDFDFSKPDELQNNYCGTRYYIPTKMPKNLSLKRADIYAFGKILCVIFQRAVEHKQIFRSDAKDLLKLFYNHYTPLHYTHTLTGSWKIWADICLECCAKIPPLKIPSINTFQTINTLNI